MKIILWIAILVNVVYGGLMVYWGQAPGAEKYVWASLMNFAAAAFCAYTLYAQRGYL